MENTGGMVVDSFLYRLIIFACVLRTYGFYALVLYIEFMTDI